MKLLRLIPPTTPLGMLFQKFIYLRPRKLCIFSSLNLFLVRLYQNYLFILNNYFLSLVFIPWYKKEAIISLFSLHFPKEANFFCLLL